MRRSILHMCALALAIVVAIAPIPAFAQLLVSFPFKGKAGMGMVSPPGGDATSTPSPSLVSFPFKGKAGMGMVSPSGGDATSTPSPPNPSRVHALAGPVCTSLCSRSAAGDMSPESPPRPLEGEGFEQPRTPIPPVTPADRAAAFPDVAGHAVHDDAIHHYVRFNRLETWDADAGRALGWEGSAWIGTDLDRLWLRSEGERVDGTTEAGDFEVLYGRSVAPWWDVVVGVREDLGEACPEPCRRSSSQTFAAIGVQGLAPYKFEFQATAYLGESGQSAANIEIEYDTLLTNRLILQWLAEADWYGKDDARRGIGSGLGTVEAGLRLRYEITRRFAPYLGIVRERAYGATADLRRAQFDDADDIRVVAGVRVWF